MPAYNASKTLRTTCAEVPMDIVDEIILVDDASCDETVAVAKELGLKTSVHPKNRGYGGNQKSCYKTALDAGAGSPSCFTPTTSTRQSWCRPWRTSWNPAFTTSCWARVSWVGRRSRAACRCTSTSATAS